MNAFRLTATALVLAGVIAVSHIASVPTYSDASLKLLDSLHAPFFGLVAVSLHHLVRRHVGVIAGYVYSAAGAFSLGLGGELLQYFSPRNADLHDLARDALGIAAFLGARALLDPPLKAMLGRGGHIAMFAIVLPLLAASLLPSAWLSYAFLARSAMSPTLISFDSAWERNFYHGRHRAPVSTAAVPAGWPIQTGKIAMIEMSGGSNPGIAIHGNPDWRGFAKFSFVAATAGGNPGCLNLRVHDAGFDPQKEDDYFNEQLELPATPKRFEFDVDSILQTPGGRRMDAGAITSIIVYGAADGCNQPLLLDDFRLSNPRATAD